MSNAVVDPTEIIIPSQSDLTITLGEGEETLYLTARPLSFFGKMEFFSVMGRAIEQAFSGGSGLNDLLDVPDVNSKTPLSADNFVEAETFVKAVANLVQYAPDMLLDLYCVIFQVPRGQREYVKARLERELDDDQAFAVMNHFVDNEWDVMVSFFSQRILPLFKKASSKVQGSQQSKPSKTTARRTAKGSKK